MVLALRGVGGVVLCQNRGFANVNVALHACRSDHMLVAFFLLLQIAVSGPFMTDYTVYTSRVVSHIH